ncbi:uncharacterized protein [Dysidea avara]|uniref:uncharacterized protein n=1 Tax=Dysidea avara TaxID=196820 RepID=UPI003324085E
MRRRGNQSVVIMKRKIRKAKLSLVCSSLPTPAKRQKPSTQRVGSIADRKRKLQDSGKHAASTTSSVKALRPSRNKGCGDCDGCTAENCGRCKHCRDMKKFGGKGRKKQKCLARCCTLQHKKNNTGGFEDPESSLKDVQRKLLPICADGNCMFRSFSVIMYGSEIFHTKVRMVLHKYIMENQKDFSKYVSGEMETHLKSLMELGRWGTQVELKAAAGITQLPIYVYTPTLRADGQYAWNKIVPCTHSPPLDTVSIPDHLKDLGLNHIELCHTKGIHYDIIVCADGSYPGDIPKHTFCM